MISPPPRVLYVEDRVDLRRRVVDQHLCGADVVEVGSVREARHVLEHPGALGFQAVLLDHSLPDGTGVEVLQLLQARGSTARVIAVSRDAELNELLMEAGADLALSRAHLDQLGPLLGLPRPRP